MSFFFKDPVTFTKRPEGTDEFSRKLVAYDGSGFGWVVTPDLSGTGITLQPNPTFYRDFATFKTLNHGEGPNINFTRGTSATYFDSAGVLQMANINEPRFDHNNFRTNLATWSVFTSSGNLRWTNVFPSFATILTGIDAPDGSTTAVRLSANNQGAALLRVNITPFTVSVSGTPYTLSFWCRRVSGTGAAVMDVHDGAPNGSYDSQLVTGKWRRVSLSGIPLSGTKTFIDVCSNNATTNLVLDYWGLQLETGLSATAYIPVSGSVVTVGDSRGLLIEESRTNLLERSAEFDNAYWSKVNASAAANWSLAPDNTTMADLLTSSITGGSNTCYVDRTITVATSTDYTFSVFLKAGTSAKTTVNLYRSSPFLQAVAEITWTSTPTMVASGTALVGSSLTILSNGWIRASLTINSGPATSLVSRVYVLDQGSSNSTSDSVLLWGAQLEAGAFPTSYIPTTTAAATRSIDGASVTPVSSFYNESEGTIFVESSLPLGNRGTPFTQAHFSDNTSNNEIWLYRDNTRDSVVGLAKVAGAGTGDATTSISASADLKACAAFKANDSAQSINGSAATTGSVTALPTGVTHLSLGLRPNPAGGRVMSSHLRKIAYWPKRLSNAFLQQQTQ